MTIKLISREVFVPAPEPGVSANAVAFYTSTKHDNMTRLVTHVSKSDTVDCAFLQESSDGGKTWSEPFQWDSRRELEDGRILRLQPRVGVPEPGTGRFISFDTVGLFDVDRAHEGLTRYHVTCAISEDGRHPREFGQPIIHEGEEYDAQHPLPGVYIGTNSFSVADFTTRPIFRDDGVLLLPIQVTPIDEDGNRIDPYGVEKYRHSQLLMGHKQPDGSYRWRASERIKVDFALSTRGVLEPTIAPLNDGKLLMIMRGSNAKAPEIQSRRWYAISSDGGETWSTPQPWADTAGKVFFSPSSCSQLVHHSSGRVFWFGNLCATNPSGNQPRYPINAVEVDKDTGLAIAENNLVVDDRQQGEGPCLNLSNFMVEEDRATGHLLLYLTRKFASFQGGNDVRDWTADALVYRLEV